MTRKELKIALDELGIGYSNKASLSKLQSLLPDIKVNQSVNFDFISPIYPPKIKGEDFCFYLQDSNRKVVSTHYAKSYNECNEMIKNFLK